MSYLVAQSDDGHDISISILESIEIGRSYEDFTVLVRSGDDIISLGISDATVSRVHTCVYLEYGRLMVKDLGSKNGTLVNDVSLPGWEPGKESHTTEIRNDSILKLGYNTQIRLIIGEPTQRIGELDVTR